MLLSICIPMYNESPIIESTIASIDEATKKLSSAKGIDCEVIFSDDGSKDQAREIAEAYIKDHQITNARVIGYPDNRGKGSAVREAVLNAQGDIIITTDCDLAFGTDVFASILEAFSEDEDLVIGSRRLDKEGYKSYSAGRKLFSWGYMQVLRLVTGFKGTDSQCGCKAYRKEAGKAIFSRCECNGFAFDQEVLLFANKFNFKIKEIPVRVINHRASSVRIVRDSLKMLRQLFQIKKHVKSTN